MVQFSGDIEVRRKISKSLKGNIPWNKNIQGLQIAWNKDIPHSEETKQKLCDAWLERKLRGDKGTFAGKNHSDDTKKFLSILNKGKIGTPSNRKGKSLSQETKDKMKLSQQIRRERESNENNS